MTLELIEHNSCERFIIYPLSRLKLFQHNLLWEVINNINIHCHSLTVSVTDVGLPDATFLLVPPSQHTHPARATVQCCFSVIIFRLVSISSIMLLIAYDLFLTSSQN